MHSPVAGRKRLSSGRKGTGLPPGCFLKRRGRHNLKYGINVPDWSRRGLRDETDQFGTFYFGSLTDYSADRPFLAIAHRGNPRVVFWEKNIGVFFQDDIPVSPRLQVSVGLRY